MLRTLMISLFSAVMMASSLNAVDTPSLKELEGNYPITMPTYDGVDQLIFLNQTWLVVITNNMTDVEKQVRNLSGGAYPGNSSTIKNYWVQARENAGERKLDDRLSYTISSPDDPAYAGGRNPNVVYRWITPLDKETHPGFVSDYAHYSYLGNHSPYKNGKTYTITLDNGKSVTFTYDETRTISRSIETNQAGYLTNSTAKYAYLSLFVPGFGPMAYGSSLTFSVINANDLNPNTRVVLSGPVELREADPKFETVEKQSMTGTNVYQMDISALKTPGLYFISIPTIGRSWPFKVGDDVANNPYNEAFYTAARGMYHLRANTAIEKPYSNWTHDRCDWGDILESNNVPFLENVKGPAGYKVFDAIGRSWHDQKGKLGSVKSTKDVAGGWFDAGDFDRRHEHFTNILDLLYLFEFFGNAKFKDGQLNLPESGNGIPDVLDEAEYGLRIWKASQDKTGGIAGAVETWDHPGWCDKSRRWFFSKRTRWSSLLYAAAAAQYARLVEEFDSDKATEYRNSAMAAYAFGLNPANSIKGEKEWAYSIPMKEKGGKGANYTVKWGEKWDYILPYHIAARMQLYLLTKDDDFVTGKGIDKNNDRSLDKLLTEELVQNHRGPYQRQAFRETDFSPWLYYGVLHPDMAGMLDEDVIDDYRDKYIAKGKELRALSKSDPYRRSKNRKDHGKMAWGYGTMTNYARALLIAHKLTGTASYLDAALFNTDYMLGGNPMGMSWTTGIGWVYPVAIHHRISRDIDNIDDPVPGIAIFGPTASNEGKNLTLFNFLWAPQDPVNKDRYHWFVPQKSLPIPLLRRWVAHPSRNVMQNEFTIFQTMSPGIFVYGYLMANDGWEPSEALKERQPRPKKDLFGRYYLP